MGGRSAARSVDSAAMELTWALDTVPDRTTRRRVTAEMLSTALGGEVVDWSRLDLVVGDAQILPFPEGDWDLSSLSHIYLDVAQDHPMLRSYLAEPPRALASPRRLSDFSTRAAVRRTRSYADLMSLLGAERQLTILTARPSRLGGQGWAVNRSSGSDFSDRDVELAAALQPVLVLLERVDDPAPAREGEASAAAERLGLTAREIEVLRHVSTGMTADAIARLLRISGRTVRKHLENAYRKLDCHDRLLAVQQARALRLI